MTDLTDPPLPIRDLAAAFALPPDTEAAGHPGTGRNAWRLESASTGGIWHLRIQPVGAGIDEATAFRAGRDLSRRAEIAGGRMPASLAAVKDDPAISPFSPDMVEVREWIDGRSLDAEVVDAGTSPGAWLGDTMAAIHRTGAMARRDDDALAAWYGLHPRTRWEGWFNAAEDADLPWTALAPAVLPVIAEVTLLVTAGLRIRSLAPVVTHRLVEPRHVIAIAGGYTLIDPFSAGLDLDWLEMVDVAVRFPHAAPVALESYARSGGNDGPRNVEAMARHYGREMHGLAGLMSRALASPADDEEAVATDLDAITAKVQLLTGLIERLEAQAAAVFG